MEVWILIWMMDMEMEVWKYGCLDIDMDDGYGNGCMDIDMVDEYGNWYLGGVRIVPPPPAA